MFGVASIESDQVLVCSQQDIRTAKCIYVKIVFSFGIAQVTAQHAHCYELLFFRSLIILGITHLNEIHGLPFPGKYHKGFVHS